MDEDLRSARTQQQNGSPQRVPVAVQLLCAHAAEQIGEDTADVPVHPLQSHVQALSRRLVQKALQSADICKKPSTELFVIVNRNCFPTNRDCEQHWIFAKVQFSHKTHTEEGEL